MKTLLRSLGLMLLLGVAPLFGAEATQEVQPVATCVANTPESDAAFEQFRLNAAKCAQVLQEKRSAELDWLLADRRFIDHFMIPINRIRFSIKFAYYMHDFMMLVDWKKLLARYPELCKNDAVNKICDFENGREKTVLDRISIFLEFMRHFYAESGQACGLFRYGIYSSNRPCEGIAELKYIANIFGLMKKPIAEQQAG